MSTKARKMARLSAKIFGEVVRQTSKEDYKVYELFSRYRTKPGLPSYYPPLPTYQALFLRLRKIGLFHDEHEDFIDQMTAKRISRGKGAPQKGQGKRAKKK